VKHDEMLWNICKDLDVHGDKSISKEEMSSFIKKNPVILIFLIQKNNNGFVRDMRLYMRPLQ
jgi:hypothetical protein